jgi:hypothetical protein
VAPPVLVCANAHGCPTAADQEVWLMHTHFFVVTYADVLCRCTFSASGDRNKAAAVNFLFADLDCWGGNVALTCTVGM